MELRVVIQGSSLKFIIIPQGQGSEQYHIEFANIKSFLSRENFMVLHLKYLDFMDLKLKLKPHIDSRARLNVNYVTEQAQIGKELIKYSVIPVQRYSFNISKFKYVADLLRHNQAKISAPIVSYNSTMAQGQGVSSPILKFGRALTSFSTGKPLCRVQIILMITHPNFKKNAESAAIFSENEPDQDANNDIFFEVKTGDFLNMVDTYTEKFGPLYLC